MKKRNKSNFLIEIIFGYPFHDKIERDVVGGEYNEL